MKEQFIERKFTIPSLNLIQHANAIIAEYMEKGYTLTLRQLYYQFVARDLLANTMRSYKNLGSVINDARLAGMIDWDAIEDRTRSLMSIANYPSPQTFLRTVVPGYAENLWLDQPYYCEVWIEKEALAGVVERSCNRLRVPFFSCRGYGSQSEMYSAGKRMLKQQNRGKHVVMFHLGDHDPSGLDMTRDNEERLNMFAEGGVEVRRLALNKDQIDLYDPPPNPVKLTDTRSANYIGDESWELDALDPEVIDKLISDAIESIIDKPKMTAAANIEREQRANLMSIARNYPQALNAAKLVNVREAIEGDQG